MREPGFIQIIHKYLIGKLLGGLQEDVQDPRASRSTTRNQHLGGMQEEVSPGGQAESQPTVGTQERAVPIPDVVISLSPGDKKAPFQLVVGVEAVGTGARLSPGLLCPAAGRSPVHPVPQGLSLGVTGRWGHADSGHADSGNQLAATADYLMERFLHQC